MLSIPCVAAVADLTASFRASMRTSRGMADEGGAITMKRIPASLTLCSAVVLTFLINSNASAGGTTEFHLIASDGDQHNQFGYSVSLSGDTALVGAPHDDSAGSTDADSAYVFVRSGEIWIQQAKLTASDSVPGDFFGESVSLSGDTALVGARGDDTAGGIDAGSAYVFVRNGTTWSQQAKLTASDAAADDRFGFSVSISGDSAVVGAHFDDTTEGNNSGSAYVFVRNGTTWTQQAKLTDLDADANDRLGSSVSISGDTALVGAPEDDTDDGGAAGSASAFVRNGATWTQQAKLTAPEGSANDRFGASVSLSVDTALVGVPGDTHAGGLHAGSAYVFIRNGAIWSPQAYFTDAVSGDAFGHSVSVSGDTALVGAYLYDTAVGVTDNVGTAYVYKRNGAAWMLQAQLTASDAAIEDRFAYSVSLSGNTAAAGAVWDDTADGEDAGSAYLFQLMPASPADLDGDGDVNGIDLAMMLAQWSGASTYAPCPPHKPADLNQDCKVNGLDLAMLLAAWTG